MPEEKKTHSLTILMLKEDVGIDDAVKDRASLQSTSVEVGGEACDFVYKQNIGHLPRWVKLFQSRLGDELGSLRNSGTAAVLLVPVNERLFALTFGYGRSLLNPDCYEESFGLRVVLNSVNSKKLRCIDIQSLDAVPLNRRNQSSIATDFADFGLDIEQDLICAATGKPKDSSFGKLLTGKDALKVSLPFVLDDLPSLLTRLQTQFTAESYKQSFAWVDHLREVRTSSFITTLDEKLEEKLRNREFERTWLSIPEIIDWADISGFKYQRLSDDEREDIDWESYLDFLGEGQPCTVDKFRKHRVLAISSSSGQEAHSWPLYKCIYCELTHEGADYALSNGKWYRVDKNFLADLNAAIASIPVSDLTLPDFHGKDEGSYNTKVHEENPAYFALMDRKIIRHGGGGGQIEFCDLYTTDRHFIHVKRYGGSSVLSHLFSQGTVSARLFLSDREFREKANQELPSTHKIENVESKPEAGRHEVVYAIASTHASGNPQLPLFSKINLRNNYNHLRTYGMKASLRYIQIAPSPEIPE